MGVFSVWFPGELGRHLDGNIGKKQVTKNSSCGEIKERFIIKNAQDRTDMYNQNHKPTNM